MATKVNINGKLVTRPGVYTLVKSGIKNNPVSLPYGNVCIIDDGIGAGYGGGSGSTKYEFTNVQDFQSFVKGGPLWYLGKPLFKPGTGFNGVSKLTLVQARTASVATLPFVIAAGDADFVTKDKGLNANGVEDGDDILRQGYGGTLTRYKAPTTDATFATTTFTAASSGIAQINRVTPLDVHEGDVFSVTIGADTVSYTALSTDTVASVITSLVTLVNASPLGSVITATANAAYLILTADVVNTPFTQTSVAVPFARFQFNFYHGSYKGINPLTNLPYDNVTEENSVPILLFQSDPVRTLTELKAWADKSRDFQAVFTYTIGTGAIVVGDLASNTGNQLAAGATENYGASDWLASLAVAKVVDNSIYLAAKFGDDAEDAHNDELLETLLEYKYIKFLVVGGGKDSSEFEPISVHAAEHFDHDQVIIVHGDGKLTSRQGFTRVDSLYKAAAVVGRVAGLEPQTPLTWKKLAIDAEWEELDSDQLDQALADGVLVSFYDDELGYTCVLQDTTSLQNNDYLVNDDGTSFSWSVKRIEAQLNKELAIYIKKKFFGNQSAGPNRNTITEADIAAGCEAFLQTKIASTNTDNLILSFKNVIVTVDQDNYFVAYEFVPNYPVNKIVITGTILAS